MRRLLLGLIALLGLLQPAEAQRWRPGGFRPGLSVLGGSVATYVGPIAGNTVVPTSALTTGMSKQTTIHTVRAPGGTTDMQVVEPGWYVAGGYLAETPLAANFTYEAAVRSPPGTGAWTRITTGGSNVGNCVAGTNCYSDLSAIVLADGAQFELWECLIGPSLPQLSASSGKALATDEGRASSTAGSCGSPGSVTDNDGGPRRFRSGAVAILGHRTGDSVAVIGDSQVAFVSSTYTSADEVPTSTHDRGDIPATIGGTYAYLNLGVGGDAWSTALWSFANRLELARKATIVADEEGTNEFNVKAAATAANPLAIKARAAPYFSGKKLIYATLTPRTTGAWTSADGSDQTVASYSTAIPTYNAGLTINGAAPLDRFTTLQNGTAANKWCANGTAAYCTRDGLHLSTTAAYTLMPANAATWVAQLQALTTSTPVQPVMDFTGAGTYSGGYLVSGTVTQATGAPGLGVQSLVLRFKVAATQSAQQVFLVNNSNPWIKTIQVTAGGLISVQNATGTIYATSGSVRDGVEHELAVIDDGTTQTAYLDGVSFGSATYTHGGSFGLGGLSLAASSASTTAISIREVTLWNKVLYSANYTPALFTGTESGLIALWHLATSNAAVLGPVLPQ